MSQNGKKKQEKESERKKEKKEVENFFFIIFFYFNTLSERISRGKNVVLHSSFSFTFFFFSYPSLISYYSSEWKLKGQDFFSLDTQ